MSAWSLPGRTAATASSDFVSPDNLTAPLTAGICGRQRRLRDDRKSARLPMYHGARGKFSEVDSEGFAIHMLRAYRRQSGFSVR